MKVLIVSDAQSTHTKRWVSALKGRGIDVILFSIKPSLDDFFDNLGIRSYYFDLFTYKKSGDGAIIALQRHFKALKYLKQVLRKEKPDILHSHYLTSYSLIAALANYKPLIVSMWGSDIYLFPKKNVVNKLSVKYILKRATKVLSTSNVMAKEARKYTYKPISITPFGVDTDLFKPSGEVHKQGTFTIGTVKSLSANYGIDVLINAFKIVSESKTKLDLRLVIVGKGPDLEKLKELASDLSISDKVIFMGFVENPLLPPIFSTFDVSVYPSLSESFGVSALESMACKCPVVVSDADGFTEVVSDGVDGFFVPKGNPMAVAVAIEKFINNPDLIRQMGDAGRTKVMEKYSWEESVNKMISIYNERS